MSDQLALDVNVKHPISPKLAEQLGKWTCLYPFFEGPYWQKIKAQLKSDMPVTTPIVENWFKAFRCTTPENLKVVWLGMSPYFTVDKYTQKPVADGLAFSTDTRNDVPPSLYKLYKGIEWDLYKGMNLDMERCNKLEWLAEQGVLLLNAALTTRYGDSKAHLEIWRPFTDYVIDYLNNNYVDLVFVGFGGHAHEYLKRVDTGNHKVILPEHPAASAYASRDWEHQNVFSRTNDYLRSKNKQEILWDKYLVDMVVPF